MGERKVLNKYFPPDFDPLALPKGKRLANDERKVRMMLPMSVRCNTCGNFMYKGTKFNTRMETVAGETYLGLKIFRFYYRCTACAAEFCMKTDPQSTDYTMEGGASRNYEPWRDKEVVKEEAMRTREEEEMGNAMKALENRTLDSKREMDIMEALDEVQTLNARHNKVSTEDALAALQREAARQVQDVEQEELDDLAEFHQLRRQQLQQLQQQEAPASSSSSDEGDGEGEGGGFMKQGEARKRSRQEPGGLGEAGRKLAAGAGPSSSGAVAAATELQGLPEPSVSRKPAAAAVKPMFKVVAKPKAPPVAAKAVEEAEEEEGGGLGGLLGYSSGDSQ